MYISTFVPNLFHEYIDTLYISHQNPLHKFNRNIYINFCSKFCSTNISASCIYTSCTLVLQYDGGKRTTCCGEPVRSATGQRT